MSNSRHVWIGADPTARPASILLGLFLAIGAAACTAPVPAGEEEGGEAAEEEEKDEKTKKPGETGEGSAASIDVEDNDARVDKAHTLDLAAKDTTRAKRKYRIVSGELPPGMTIGEDGKVSGTPNASGARKAVVHGEGSCGDASCRLEVNLTINVPNVVLLSGFGPFEGYPQNPSWMAVEPLNDVMIGGYDVRVIQVPVIWDEAVVKYTAAYDRLHPAMALASGVAMDTGVRLETTARNYARGADVANDVWPAGKIEGTGAATYKSGLPIDLLKGTLEEAKVPVLISDNAGDYLCNFLFYGLMKKVTAEKPANMIAGFVHVPTPDVVPTTQLTNAWKLMIEKLVSHQRALAANGLSASDADANANEMMEGIVHTPPKYISPVSR